MTEAKAKTATKKVAAAKASDADVVKPKTAKVAAPAKKPTVKKTAVKEVAVKKPAAKKIASKKIAVAETGKIKVSAAKKAASIRATEKSPVLSKAQPKKSLAPKVETTKPASADKTKLSPEERYRMVETTAYSSPSAMASRAILPSIGRQPSARLPPSWEYNSHQSQRGFRQK